MEETTEQSRLIDAPLNARLKAVADEVARLSPDFAAVVERMVARLEANEVGQSAPQVGEPMPDFILPDEKGALVRPRRASGTLGPGGGVVQPRPLVPLLQSSMPTGRARIAPGYEAELLAAGSSRFRRAHQ